MTTRAGDYDYPGLPRYISALETWFHQELQRAYYNAVLPDGEWRLCLATLVYGSYVDRFLDLCVPSLLAPGNIRSLNDPLLIIHTDAASVSKLLDGLREIETHARVEIHTVPDELLTMVPENPANKYWLLGGVGNLHMQQAKYRAHAYHMLMPDHIYATGYFAGIDRLRREGKGAIVQGALSAIMEDVAPILAAVAGEVPPDRLNALALDHMHPQIRPLVMNDRGDWPSAIFMLMIGEHSARIISPHMSIVYLSHEVLMRGTLRLFNTIDAQLPFFVPDDVELYVPTIDDCMAYIELSDADKPYRQSEGYPLEKFCATFWTMVACNPDFMRFFSRPTVIALPANYAPPFNCMPDEHIDKLIELTLKAINESREIMESLLPPHMRIDQLAWQRQILGQAKGN